MGETFVVDGMHCVFQNSLRRFIYNLCDCLKKDRPYSTTNYYRVRQLYTIANFSREFSRLAWNFDNFDMWKATEFRMSLIYGGDEVLASKEGASSFIMSSPLLSECFLLQ